jgi:hypothetical protein
VRVRQLHYALTRSTASQEMAQYRKRQCRGWKEQQQATPYPGYRFRHLPSRVTASSARLGNRRIRGENV